MQILIFMPPFESLTEIIIHWRNFIDFGAPLCELAVGVPKLFSRNLDAGNTILGETSATNSDQGLISSNKFNTDKIV